MADFLTRLSDRTLGRAPLAQPRPLPLFEPAGAQASAAPILDPAGDIEGAPQLAVRGSARARVPEAPQPPDPVVVPSLAAPEAERPGGEPGVEHRATVSTPEVWIDTPRVEDPARPARSQEAEPPEAIHSPLRAAPAALVGKTSGPEPAPRPPTLAEVAAPMPSRRAGDDAEGRLADRRSEPAAPMAPTVRVTIGRVEVRAVMPPPARERPARKSALMSLDDYLKRGRGQP